MRGPAGQPQESADGGRSGQPLRGDTLRTHFSSYFRSNFGWELQERDCAGDPYEGRILVFPHDCAGITFLGNSMNESEVRTYKDGDIIFTAEDPADGVFMVTSGIVSIYIKGTDETGGRITELGQVGRGGMFGEMGVIDLKGRSANAMAIEDTEVVYIPNAAMVDHMARLPLWSLLMIQMLVRRLRGTMEQLQDTHAELDELATKQGEELGIFQVPFLDAEDGVLVKSEEVTTEALMKDFAPRPPQAQ